MERPGSVNSVSVLDVCQAVHAITALKKATSLVQIFWFRFLFDLVHWIRRRNLAKSDSDIPVLAMSSD
eukprot:5023875-Amphidinium_carterae.1